MTHAGEVYFILNFKEIFNEKIFLSQRNNNQKENES